MAFYIISSSWSISGLLFLLLDIGSVVMTELTDLEICQRIAEIEGVSNIIEIDAIEPYLGIIDGNIKPPSPVKLVGRYDPLKDDALCFRLMKKHEVDLASPYRPNKETSWCADIFVNTYSDSLSVQDDNPNKAICLAIIEAHKND
jgi:hypothetical protein